MDTYSPGKSQPSYDKQYVRDYLNGLIGTKHLLHQCFLMKSFSEHALNIQRPLNVYANDTGRWKGIFRF